MGQLLKFFSILHYYYYFINEPINWFVYALVEQFPLCPISVIVRGPKRILANHKNLTTLLKFVWELVTIKKLFVGKLFGNYSLEKLLFGKLFGN